MNTAGNIETGSTGQAPHTATEVRGENGKSETLSVIETKATSPANVSIDLSDNSYSHSPRVPGYRTCRVCNAQYTKPVDDYNHVYGDRAEKTLAYINDAVNAGFSTGHITAVAKSVLRGPRQMNAFQ